MQQPLKGLPLAIATISIALGIFMNILDTTIANVAIPTIAGNMGVSADEGTWVITSFAVTTAIVLPLTGWLAKQFGEVRLFVASTFLFTIASICCGLSQSLPMLLFFRVIQGAVAGPMIPLSQSLLLANFPPEKKGLATGLWAMVAVAAPVLGPILGGYITDNYSWPWIFYINVPVGIFSVFFTWSILKDRETPIRKLPMDYVGLILLIIGIGCLQILLDKGKDLDWFNSNIIVTLSVIVIISLTFLIIWELTEKNPIVDLTLFKRRNFTIGTIAISIGYGVYFGAVVILPLWLQTQMNYTPTWAGLAMAPLGILPIILSPIVGRLVGKIDPRILVSLGFFVFGFCAFWQSGFDTNVNFGKIAWLRFFQGIGAPFFFIPTIAILLSGLPDKDIANAAGLSNFLRLLAGSFGTSISVTVWSNRESIHQSKVVENLANYNPNLIDAIQKFKSLGFSESQSYGEVMHQIINQSYMMSTNDVFWISGYLFFSLLILIWFSRPPFTAGGEPSVAAH